MALCAKWTSTSRCPGQLSQRTGWCGAVLGTLPFEVLDQTELPVNTMPSSRASVLPREGNKDNFQDFQDRHHGILVFAAGRHTLRAWLGNWKLLARSRGPPNHGFSPPQYRTFLSAQPQGCCCIACEAVERTVLRPNMNMSLICLVMSILRLRRLALASHQPLMSIDHLSGNEVKEQAF